MVALNYASSNGGGDGFGRRVQVAGLVVALVLSLIVLRLWYLQGLYGAYYRDKSENNRTRNLRTTAPRGSLFDREGRLLVGSRPAFNIALLLEDIKDLQKTISLIAQVTGRDEAQLSERLQSRRNRPFEPKVILTDVSRQELARLKVNTYRLPGVIVEVAPRRMYPWKSLAAQTFGYAREISREELGLKKVAYHSGDLIGKTGVEKQWESKLRGRDGFIQLEVDAHGNRRKMLGIADYEPGTDLYLTLDYDLQRVAEEALSDRKGAVVVMDPKNGDLLALASTPSYDANVFSGPMTLEAWRAIKRNPDHPLQNRAFSEAYPPGSTFKLLLAVAGLMEGKISLKTEYDCPGYFKLGRRRFHCHKRSGHGKVNLRKALEVSCNAYFYRLGTELGIDNIFKYGKMFGFGEKTGVHLNGEISGILPSRKWKRSRFHEPWYPGDTVPVAIGQGYLTVTPLQLVSAVSTIVNGGKRYRPRLVYQAINSVTGETNVYDSELVEEIPVAKRILNTVRFLAQEVVEGERGTGHRAKIEGISVGGKTGTAQVVRLKNGSGEKEDKDHAWFVSFAPVEDPQIVIAVVVENAGHGGVEAAPISQKVMTRYFKKKNLLPKEDIAEPTLIGQQSLQEG